MGGGRRRLAAAIVIVGLVGLGTATAIVANASGGSGGSNDGVAPRHASRSSTSSSPSTSTPTSTSVPALALAASGSAALVAGAPADLPHRGFVVVDGDRLVVTDDEGVVLADGSGRLATNQPDIPLTLRQEGNRVMLEETPTVGPSPAQFGPDCIAVFGAGGAPNAARCGASDVRRRRIDVATGPPTAIRTLLTTPPAHPGQGEVLGHWQSIDLSPDGRWLLALWSGECESPTTFLLPMTGARTATTVDGKPLARWADAAETMPVGWTADGRARFVAGAGACGNGLPVPGVYAVRPDARGRPELLYRATADHPSAFSWRRDFSPPPDGSAPPATRSESGG